MKKRFNSIHDVHEYIDSIPNFGTIGAKAAHFSLDHIRELFEVMRNPQDSYPTIHVAGTNGKGSVCRLFASVLQSSGYKTGLYTSPHLVNYKERFKINGNYPENNDFIEFFNTFRPLIERFDLTYFELSTALAFWIFEKHKVDIAVIETGLGGRLDTTNIITPILSIITSIGLDHSDILGDTLGEIAEEKAGIIKPGIPVVIGKLPQEAERRVQEKAKSQNTNVSIAKDLKPIFKNKSIHLQKDEKKIVVKDSFYRQIDALNSAIVYQGIQAISNKFPITDRSFCQGILKAEHRFSIHAHFKKLDPFETWYFDGAHNIEAVNLLINQLKQIDSPENWTVIYSSMSDKLNQDIAKAWSEFKSFYLFPMSYERASGHDELKKYFPNARSFPTKNDQIEKILNDLKRELVIFTGSFYFYNVIQTWMGTKMSESAI